jgi:hypothetical protein
MFLPTNDGGCVNSELVTHAKVQVDGHGKLKITVAMIGLPGRVVLDGTWDKPEQAQRALESIFQVSRIGLSDGNAHNNADT